MSATFLTANDLRTGEVVFWTHQKTWSVEADQAMLATTKAAQDALAQVLKDPHLELEVVGAYLVNLAACDTSQALKNHPKKFRERRRLAGPTLSPTPIPHAA